MKTNEIHSISIRTMYSICIYYQSTVCVISVVIGILYSIQLLDNIKLLMVHIGRIMKYTRHLAHKNLADNVTVINRIRYLINDQ